MIDAHQAAGVSPEPDVFRLLADNIADYALFVIDADRKVQTWNPGAMRLLGYTAEEILGSTSDRFFTPDDIASGRPEAEVREALETGRGENDRWHVRKDGSRFWSAGVLTPLRDKEGRLHGFVKIMRDQTALRQAEQARRDAEERLRQCEERFRALMDQAPFSVQILAADGRTVRVNRAWAELWGLRPEQLDGYNMLLDSQLEVKGILQHLRRAFEGTAAYLPEITYDPEETLPGESRNERSVRWVSAVAYPLKDAEGQVREVAIVHEDTTARRLAEAEVREKADVLSGILHASVDHIYVVGADGRYRYVSAGAARTLGFDPTQMIGRDWNELGLPAEIMERFDVQRDEVLRSGRPVHCEVDFTAPDEERRTYEYVIAPLAREGNPADSVVVVSRDVTDRRRSEQLLDRYRLLSEYARDIVFFVRDDGRIVEANEAAEDAYGYDRETLLTMSVWDLRATETREDIPHQLAAASDQGLRFETMHRRRDGTSIPVEVSSRGAQIGGERLLLSVVRDVTERKQAEAALRDSEAKFRSLYETNVVGVAFWSAEGALIEVNDALLQFLGYTRADSEVSQLDWRRLTPPEYEADDERALAEMALHGRFVPFEKEFFRKDGTRVPVLVGGALLPGHVDRGVSFVVDLTARKRAESELARVSSESDRRRRLYETILSNTPDFAYVFDLDHRFTYANDVLLRMWGRTWDDAIGKTCLELGYEPWHAAMHDREIEQVKKTRKPIRGEVPFTGTIGRRIYDYIFVPVIGENGEVEAIAGTTRDVTERKRSEADARFLADASAALADLSDPDSTLTRVASLAVPRFADWCAIDLLDGGALRRVAVSHVDPHKVELAHEYHRRFPPDLTAPQGIAKILRTGAPELVAEITDELLEITVNEPERLQLLRALGLRSFIGVPLKIRDQVLGVLTFIAAESGRRYDEADLRTAEDLARRAAVAIENARLYGEMRSADRRKDEFLAMLGHELRNPLAPIRSGLDLLKLSAAEPEVVNLMAGQVDHLVRLVDDLLDVSRILRGRIELKRSAIDLVEIVSTAVHSMRPMFAAERQNLTLQLPSQPMLVEADPVRLTQVLTNLLTNASKYTERNGNISLVGNRVDGEVVIRVSDTGIGIDAELLPHVFELFTQSTRAIDRAQGGLGLGLTIVKNLVEMHGGTVVAESDGPGRGSTFSVRLPVLDAVTEEIPPPASLVPSEPRGILVVDDNVPAAKLLVRLLSKLGSHDVVTAHDGEAALAAAAAYRPDLILLDIGLPKLDGYEVARRLRSQPHFDSTLLVALTGYGTEADRKRSREAGFDEHVTKPPGVNVLRKVLSHPKLVRR